MSTCHREASCHHSNPADCSSKSSASLPTAGHNASYHREQLLLSFKASEPLQVTHTLTNSSWVVSAHMLLKDDVKDITINLQTQDRGGEESMCPACGRHKCCTRQMGLVSCRALPTTPPPTAVRPIATHRCGASQGLRCPQQHARETQSTETFAVGKHHPRKGPSCQALLGDSPGERGCKAMMCPMHVTVCARRLLSETASSSAIILCHRLQPCSSCKKVFPIFQKHQVFPGL